MRNAADVLTDVTSIVQSPTVQSAPYCSCVIFFLHHWLHGCWYFVFFSIISTVFYLSVPPNITVNPPWQIDIEAEQNVTLTCNASGDPLPKVTWTKVGVVQDQLNFSGHRLHIINLKRTDVELYRCTANNGFGSEASRVSIVNINCKVAFHAIAKKRASDIYKTEQLAFSSRPRDRCYHLFPVFEQDLTN